MNKKRWFRFFIDQWVASTYGWKPNDRVVYLEIIVDLYDHDGNLHLNKETMARRCGLRPSSFQKSLDWLVSNGKLNVIHGQYSNRAVTKEIITREKLGQKSTKSRQKVREKRNENNGRPRFEPPYTKYKQQKEIEDVSELGGEETIEPTPELLRSLGSSSRH